MTHFRLQALSLILAVMFCAQATRAQETTTPSNNDQAANAALREKAFKLLESLADQLGTLQSAENRARIGSNLAESLWTRDEARARQLFKLVEEDIKLGFQQVPKDDHSPADSHTFQVFLKLRADNVERIAKHDPELALEFLRGTFPAVREVAIQPDGATPPRILETEQALELRLARRIGPKNADVAVQLARQSLKQGLSDDLLSLLSRLNGKHRDQAQSLYQEIVRKVDETEFDQNYRAVHFAQQLVWLFQPPAVDESTFRELIDVFLRKAFAAGCERPKSQEFDERTSLCVNIGAVQPLLMKYSPAQARRLSHWTPQEPFRPETTTQAYAELNDVTQNGSLDELLELATKYPQLQTQVYQRAVWKAQAEGDAERAQKIMNTLPVDDASRRRIESQREFLKLSVSRLEEEWSEGQKELASLPLQQQATRLLDIAAFTSPHPKFAVKLLNQAEAIINNLSPGESQTRLQIAAAATYCLLKDERGFGIIESLLPKFNDLVTAATKLDGYDTDYLRDGEWNMSAAGSVGNLLTFLAENASYFAWHDFDRAVTLSGQFERSEIRMMAQLKLAQAILAGRASHFSAPSLF